MIGRPGNTSGCGFGPWSNHPRTQPSFTVHTGRLSVCTKTGSSSIQKSKTRVIDVTSTELAQFTHAHNPQHRLGLVRRAQASRCGPTFFSFHHPRAPFLAPSPTSNRARRRYSEFQPQAPIKPERQNFAVPSTSITYPLPGLTHPGSGIHLLDNLLLKLALEFPSHVLVPFAVKA